MDANKSPRERHGRLAEWIPGKLRSRANAAEFRARCRYETFFTQPGSQAVVSNCNNPRKKNCECGQGAIRPFWQAPNLNRCTVHTQASESCPRLGRVDKSNPDANAGKQHEGREALDEFIVAGGNPA